MGSSEALTYSGSLLTRSYHHLSTSITDVTVAPATEGAWQSLSLRSEIKLMADIPIYSDCLILYQLHPVVLDQGLGLAWSDARRLVGRTDIFP